LVGSVRLGRKRDLPDQVEGESSLLGNPPGPFPRALLAVCAIGLVAGFWVAPLASQAVADPCGEAMRTRNYLTVEMEPTVRVAGVDGCGRLAIEWSPFGIAVTPDGHVRYRLDLYLTGLDRPGRSGPEVSYVAWAVSSDLSQVHRIGVVEGGRISGSVSMNQYLVVVTAEEDPNTEAMTGRIVIRGRSPTGWMEPFQHHDPYNTGMPVRR